METMICAARELKRERVSFDKALREELVRCKPHPGAVLELLTSAGVDFDVLTHTPELETHKTAGQAHITGKKLGKATLVRVSWPKQDGLQDEIIMCMVRSMDRVVLGKVVKALGARSARLCTASEVEEMVAQTSLAHDEPALPPLPSILQVSGILDAALAAQPHVYFKAGNTHQLVGMAMDVFRALTGAAVANIAEEHDLHIKPLTTMIVRAGFDAPNCLLRHPPTATATEAAKALHFPGLCTLKAVVVKLDGSRALCSVPATRAVDLPALRKLSGATSAEVVGAAELRASVPETQFGPLPPFGHLFDMKTFVDAHSEGGMLSGPVDVVFSAGTPTVSMTMRFSDYIRILRHFGEPVLGAFTTEVPAEEKTTTGAQFKKHLQANGVPFLTVKHARTFTASQTAAEARISGNQLAKTVMITDGKSMAMAAVSAADRVNLAALSVLFNNTVPGTGELYAGTQGSSCSSTEAYSGSAEDAIISSAPCLRLATEEEFAGMFADVEPGAMPPFGHLYNLRTFVDARLAENDTIYFNAGNHKVLLEVAWKDFARLVRPIVGHFTLRRSSIGSSP